MLTAGGLPVLVVGNVEVVAVAVDGHEATFARIIGAVKKIRSVLRKFLTCGLTLVYNGRMPAGRPKKATDDAPVFAFRITTEVIGALEQYAAELSKKNPGMLYTKQDAARFVLGAWFARRVKETEASR
jgi:hypothetical protein